jgi:hypothetical protein
MTARAGEMVVVHRMSERSLAEIERMLEDENRLASRELIAEAWHEGSAAGIEPELLAEEMIQALLCELAAACGEDIGNRLACKIGRLADEGRLLSPRILQ